MSYIQGELIIAVDFDGTITTNPNFRNEMVLQPNCARVLSRLHEEGVRLLLWTCRTGSDLEEAKQFLADNDLLHLFETVNDHPAEILEMYPEASRKLGADYYIDDKNLMFEVNWLAIEEYILGIRQEA